MKRLHLVGAVLLVGAWAGPAAAANVGCLTHGSPEFIQYVTLKNLDTAPLYSTTKVSWQRTLNGSVVDSATFTLSGNLAAGGTVAMPAKAYTPHSKGGCTATVTYEAPAPAVKVGTAIPGDVVRRARGSAGSAP